MATSPGMKAALRIWMLLVTAVVLPNSSCGSDVSRVPCASDSDQSTCPPAREVRVAPPRRQLRIFLRDAVRGGRRLPERRVVPDRRRQLVHDVPGSPGRLRVTADAAARWRETFSSSACLLQTDALRSRSHLRVDAVVGRCFARAPCRDRRPGSAHRAVSGRGCRGDRVQHLRERLGVSAVPWQRRGGDGLAGAGASPAIAHPSRGHRQGRGRRARAAGSYRRCAADEASPGQANDVDDLR